MRCLRALLSAQCRHHSRWSEGTWLAQKSWWRACEMCKPPVTQDLHVTGSAALGKSESTIPRDNYARLAEETTQHSASESSCQTASVESPSSQTGCLTELVASRKGQCVCNGQDKRDHCIQLLARPSQRSERVGQLKQEQERPSTYRPSSTR